MLDDAYPPALRRTGTPSAWSAGTRRQGRVGRRGRRSGARDRRRGPDVGGAAAAHPPSVAVARRPRGRRGHAEGCAGPPARPGRGGAVHRAHQRRRRGPRRLRRAGRGARAGVEGPLDPAPSPPLDKIVTFVPVGPAITAVHDGAGGRGAGAIGDYSHCSFATRRHRPVQAARRGAPTIGQVGKLERVAETKLEMVLPRARRAAVVAALRAAHPYEEPAFDVFEQADLPSSRGLGRIGTLPAAEPLRAFADRVAAALPRRPGACAPRATRSGPCAGSRCAAARATRRSARRPRPASTPT